MIIAETVNRLLRRRPATWHSTVNRSAMPVNRFNGGLNGHQNRFDNPLEVLTVK
jgi:hypothetical protein